MEEHIKEKWKLLNEIGIYTLKELHEYNRKTVINIGILGLTPEELEQKIKKGGVIHEY